MDVLARLEQEILDWFRQNQGGRIGESERASAKFNSRDVPQRLRRLFEPYQRDMARNGPFALLDIGCGYGGTAVWLAHEHPHSQIVAADPNPGFYHVGQKVARECGVENVRFACINLLDLAEVSRYDYVLLSNMLCYLTSARLLQQGCENAWRALRPEGGLVVHTPHFWTVPEPFTGLPGLQFMPAFLRERLASGLRRRSTMSDIRLPSLRALLRILARLEARDVTVRPCHVLQRVRQSHIDIWARK